MSGGEVYWYRSTRIKGIFDIQSCTNYRGIKLMSHTMKLWERVIECRVHKPGVLADRLPSKGLAQQITSRTNAQLMGRPKYLNSRPEGRSKFRPESLAEEEQRPLLISAHLSDRNARFGLQPASGRPLRLEGLAKTPLPTPTRFSDRDCVEPLLTAPLRLAQSKPTRTNRPGTPAW